MKTALSIPGPVFHAAEELARRPGMSRSELFSQAVQAWVEAHKHDRVRDALDEVYSEESSSLDEALARLQSASLRKEDW